MEASQPYYPYRAARNRPYWVAFQALAPEQRRPDSLPQLASRAASAEFKARGERGPRAVACVIRESQFCHFISDFFIAGEVVFDVARSLSDAFLRSDLGDARACDLRFPFESFYVHLGHGLGLSLNDGAADLEGAFITHNHLGDLGVALVGSLRAAPEHWAQRGLETFRFYLPGEQAERPLLDAINEELAKETSEAATLADRVGGMDGPARSGLQQTTQESLARLRVLNETNRPVVLECMQLVANVLLYLSQYPDDVQECWQPGTPKGFADKYERSAGRTRENTLSKAKSAGFTRIRRVGGYFEEELHRQSRADDAGGAGRAAHLRRAHWRLQAHGPQMALRKLVWIRVARVSGGTRRDKPYRLT